MMDTGRDTTRILPCKWIFKTKTNGKGEIVRFNSRLFIKLTLINYYIYRKQKNSGQKPMIHFHQQVRLWRQYSETHAE